MCRTKLICIPHAGGLASSYYQWKKYLDSNVELIPIELPGKGTRHSESMNENLREIALGILDMIEKDINNSSYALFGHSMGALVAFELNQAIYSAGLRIAKNLFLSGSNPPHLRPKTFRHLLSDEDFQREIFKMGGTPLELINNSEMMSMLLPILRHDIKLVEEYRLNPEWKVLDSLQVIMYGKDDYMISGNTINEWERYSNHTVLHAFEGGHFFIRESVRDVVQTINNYITS